MTRTRLVAAVGLASVLAALLADPVAAHVGSLSQTVGEASLPLWLIATTGGAIVGVSFLFATFMTDHELIRRINGVGIRLSSVSPLGVVRPVARVGSVLVLALVVASGLFGPQGQFTSFAVLVVWAGWWAGYTMTVYLVGNTWPTLNPWRAFAEWASQAVEAFDRRVGTREYPERFGVWPSVAGLLGMVFLEVVLPVASVPWILSVIVLVYTCVTLAGVLAFGVEPWFGYVDPVSRVFRWYGRLAPVQRTDEGVTLTLPNGALASVAGSRFDETPFVVALLWVTTYDGLVGTPSWNGAIGPVVDALTAAFGLVLPAGPATTVAALLVYAVAVVAGYGVFLGVYRVASRRSPDSADSFVRSDVLAERFLPALLPIAAGYHIAHFLGYFLTLAPALAAVLASPFTAPLNPQVLVLPDGFEILQLAFVVFGHMLAVWVAHGIAFEVFPGRLKPIRSQYPYTLVMVFYTTVSMWIVAQPFVAPAYL
jgi:hypothetical protein